MSVMKTLYFIGGGRIDIDDNVLTSKGLKLACPYCGKEDCYADCDRSQADMDSLESEDDLQTRIRCNSALDGVESLLLALHMEGYDVLDKGFDRAIRTTIDAIANNVV